MAGPGDNYRRIRDELPDAVALVVAAKGRTADEVAEAIDAGAAFIGQNYVQEGAAVLEQLGERAGAAEWHMIGHLQRNKVRQALRHFQVIQGVDSLRLGRAISNAAARPVRVLIEVNVGAEASKFGVAPEDVAALLEGLAGLPDLQVDGLMTMEPYCADPEEARPYFRRMRGLFREVRERAGAAPLRVLSMGMTHSWRVAAEEGATMVRIGTAIFGPRV